MKRYLTRILALVLSVIILVMALPITTFAASSSRCKHRKTSTKTYDTEYIVNDSSTHIRLRYRKEVCKSCDRIVDQWVEEKERDHDFDNDTCEDCGYKRSIADILEEDHVIVWKNGSKTVYVEGEKTRWDYAPKNINGTTMVPVTIAVEVLGGEFLYWDSDTNSAYIEIDDEEVEYQKNNKKYWVNGKRKTANQKAQIEKGKLYVELKTLTKLTHQDVDYKDVYVFISDNGVSSKEMKKIIDYLYNGNDDEDTMLDDIKAGKIYVTSSDGKHIYKRTYDTSKPCKYVDEYQCTVTNFSLPNNAVLTKNGNYLYENGKKICALPDVLKKVEYRINQLNRIIDGAENAYDNEVISKNRKKNIVNDTEDIIEEYLAVARGEKSLSKVSEVKATYVAETGDKNNTVEKIQQKLLNLGYTSQKVTGYYGDITFNNVAYFQIVNGLDVTGWVDSDTYDEITELERKKIEQPFAVITYMSYDDDGNIRIRAEGNEFSDTLKIFITQNNKAIKIFYIYDNDADIECQVDETGEYQIYVLAENQYGKYVSEKTTVNLTRKTVGDKILEGASTLGLAAWGAAEALMNDMSFGLYSKKVEVYVNIDRNEVYLLARGATDSAIAFVSAKASAGLLTASGIGTKISTALAGFPQASGAGYAISGVALAGATYMGSVSVSAVADYEKCTKEITELAQSFKPDKNGGGVGERRLRDIYGGKSQKYFSSTRGGRYVDQFADNIAHESKVGYTTLNKRVKEQILKDASLIGKEIDGAHWHFFRSEITGKIGASQELLDFLTQHGIKYTIHY